MALLKKLRQSMGGGRAQVAEPVGPETQAAWQKRYDDVLLDLPSEADASDPTAGEGGSGKRRKDFDPERLVTGLEIKGMLRSSRFFFQR